MLVHVPGEGDDALDFFVAAPGHERRRARCRSGAGRRSTSTVPRRCSTSAPPPVASPARRAGLAERPATLRHGSDRRARRPRRRGSRATASSINRQQAYLLVMLGVLTEKPAGVWSMPRRARCSARGDGLRLCRARRSARAVRGRGAGPFYRGDSRTRSRPGSASAAAPSAPRTSRPTSPSPASPCARCSADATCSRTRPVRRRDPDRLRLDLLERPRERRPRAGGRGDGGGPGGPHSSLSTAASTRRASAPSSSTPVGLPTPLRGSARPPISASSTPTARRRASPARTAPGRASSCPGTGIHVNNMLGEEDLNPLGFHSTAPGRRLPSMMAPTVVLRDGELEIGARQRRLEPDPLGDPADDPARWSSMASTRPRLSRRRASTSRTASSRPSPGSMRRPSAASRLAGSRSRAGPVSTGSSAASTRSPETPTTGELRGGGDPRRGAPSR